jgi:DNA phosphorothioation-dependent restriction protein DptH
MSFIAYTVRNLLVDRVGKFRLDKDNSHKMIVMFPSMPEKVILNISDIISNHFSFDNSVSLTLKIADVLIKDWSPEGQQKSEIHNWRDSHSNLTYYRNLPQPQNSFSLVILFGTDRVTDAASLADFYTLDPDHIWNIEMNQSFRSWITEKLNMVGLDQYEEQDLAGFDRILRPILKSGHGDIFQISDWLESLDLKGARDLAHAQQMMLGELSIFGLPVMTRFPLWKKSKNLTFYYNKSKEFFNYSIFIEPAQRDKAIKTINTILDSLSIEEPLLFPFEDEEVLGHYTNGVEFLDGLKNYIANDDKADQGKLMACDFIVIWDDILKFKKKVSKPKSDTLKKISGNPVEVFLSAIWETLREFYTRNQSSKETFISEIIISSDLFKHDIEIGSDVEQNSDQAIEYLVRLIGGIDNVLNGHINISNSDGTEIPIRSELLRKEIDQRKSKNSEPSLEFSIAIIDKEKSIVFVKRFGWRLPDNHIFRLSIELLSWAKASYENINDIHILPVFHLPYYDELLQSSADDEIRSILLHSIRDEGDNCKTATNLLAQEWSQETDSIAVSLKTLAGKYDDFLHEAVSKGLLASIFDSRSAWGDLRKSYNGVFEEFKKLSSLSSSAVLGMLTRSFLVIQSRNISSDISWHADYYEKSGIATVLHPFVLEMLEAQIVFLARCFNYSVSKELKKAPSSKSFYPGIWQTYLDLAEIQLPLPGLLYNEQLNLDTNVKGYGLIHTIGSPGKSETTLSTRQLLNYNEHSDDENSLSDLEMFRKSSESRLILRLLQDYFDLHPHSSDSINIAFYRNKNIQPIIAAVHSYLKELSRKPTAQRPNKRYILNNDLQRPYAISVTLFTNSIDETDVSSWVQQWKERWEAADTEPKYDLYRHCKFSIAHRIIEKNNVSSFQKLINDNFEADVVVLYDFIGAGDGANLFDNVAEFDVTSRDLKFPILEKANCTVVSPAERYKRKRVISNRQFILGSDYANLLHSLQSNSIQKGTLVVGSGNFTPWRKFMDSLHSKVDWVICIDPNMDERLIKSPHGNTKYNREIVGFGSGVGSHGEDNFTISTEQYTMQNIRPRLQASIKSLYGSGAGWSSEDCNLAANEVLSVATRLSGLSLIRATGIGDEYIRDFMAYALSRKILTAGKNSICESLISLDAYRHWFDLSEDQRRPDLLWICVELDTNNRLCVDMHLIECKMANESSAHLNKAKSQIDNGLRVLSNAFTPLDKVHSTNFDDKRPDRRYWWMQLHRLIACKTEVSKVEYPSVLSGLELLSEGDFEISWKASVFAFWINPDEEMKRVSFWQVEDIPEVTGNIYTIGGGFIRQLLINPSVEEICLEQLNNQGFEILAKDNLDIKDEDDSSVWQEEHINEEDNEVDLDPPQIKSNLDIIKTEGNGSIFKDSNPQPPSLKTNDPINSEESISKNTDESKVEENQESHVEPILQSAQRILLGETIRGGQKVYWEFGHKELANRHLLIFGASGQGKTYTIQCLLGEMTRFRQNSLIIDYTNGFLPNQLEEVTNKFLKPQQHVVSQSPLPINPFVPIDSDTGGIRIIENSNAVAKRIAGLFDSVYNIGDQQYSVLHEAIMDGVENLGVKMNLDEMLEIINMMTNDKKYKSSAQTLYSKLKPFILDKPFSYGQFDWDTIFMNQAPLCNIFQLAGMDMHSSRLITEFILWDLYGHLQAKGKKTDPKVIVLDEVQNLDHKEGNPLSKYLREGRKFGLSLMLATQTMSNLKKDEKDRMFNAEHKLFFKPADTELKSFAEIAGLITRQKPEVWRERLATLRKGECYSIGPALDSTGKSLISKPFKIKITSLEDRKLYKE